MSEPPRWERDAERVRKNAPAWLDFDRLPWWLFALFGVAAATRAVYLLLDDGLSGWDRVAALGLLLLVAPAQFLAAWKRRRGESFFHNISPG